MITDSSACADSQLVSRAKLCGTRTGTTLIRCETSVHHEATGQGSNTATRRSTLGQLLALTAACTAATLKRPAWSAEVPPGYRKFQGKGGLTLIHPASWLPAFVSSQEA